VYYEYKQSTNAHLAINYKLISTEDNSLLVSDLISLNNSDRVHYATFKGDKKKLIPGYWKYAKRISREDVKKDNKSDINKLQNLLKADKNIKSASTLLDELMEEAIRDITAKINKYNPEDE